MKRITLVMGAVWLSAAVAGAASDEWLNTWKNPEAAPLNFAGRKVAAVVITDDDSLRVSAEEALAREVSARGAEAVPAYRIIPKEEVRKPKSAQGWFERAGVQGLVVLRPVNVETDKVYSSFVWASGYYASPWNYWDYGWGSVAPIGKGRDQRTLTVETLLYDLSKNAPIWAGANRTTDPKDVQTYMKLLAIDVVTQLEKEGLVRKGPR